MTTGITSKIDELLEKLHHKTNGKVLTFTLEEAEEIL